MRARAVRSLAGRRTSGGQGSQSEPSGDRLIVRVVDRGPGIQPAQLERVFEPFYRAGSPGGEHRGSGLGLSLVRSFVQLHGGTVSIESTLGRGTKVTCVFPTAQQLKQTAA